MLVLKVIITCMSVVNLIHFSNSSAHNNGQRSRASQTSNSASSHCSSKSSENDYVKIFYHIKKRYVLKCIYSLLLILFCLYNLKNNIIVLIYLNSNKNNNNKTFHIYDFKYH